MTGNISKVALVGAGGTLGSYVLKALHDASYHITIISRETSTSTFSPEFKVIKSDYSPESLVQAFEGQDAVVSLVAGDGLANQQKLIDAAVAAGVPRFIPSDFGSDTANPEVLKIVPIFEGKKKIIDYLKSKEDHISWTAVVTSVFTEFCVQTGFMGYDIAKKTATIYDDGNTVFSGNSLANVARAVVQVLAHAKETKNQHVYVHSFVTSQNEILTTLERLTGAKFTVTKVSIEENTKVNLAKLSNGDYSSIPELIISAIYRKEGYGDLRNAKSGLWNDRLGVPQEKLEDVLRTIL